MKKILLFAFAAALMSVSCLDTAKWEDEEPQYAEIVTIVDGSYNSPYYVEFDNGKKASISSINNSSTITFPSEPAAMRGEVRKLIWYNPDGEPEEGFDMSVNIIAMQSVASDLIKSVDDPEVVKVIDTHDDNIAINTAVFGMNRNYLTLEMVIYKSQELNYKHSIFVAYNPDRDGVFKELYEAQKEENDGYLWLELYHDAAGDTTTNSVEKVYTSIKVDKDTIGVNAIDSYKGIKVLYLDIETNIPRIYTITFS